MRSQRSSAVVYSGGLDLVTPPLQVAPGRLINAKNYECDLNGGYRVFAGFERVDGRTSPTGGSWTVLGVTDVTGFVLGETVTGGTSSATGELIAIGAAELYMASVVGTFVDAEALTAPSASDTSNTDPFEDVTLSDDVSFNDVRYQKELHYRDLISAVPGIGPVRGVHRHLGELIAIRDFDGSEARMYRATASGWAQVVLGHIAYFDNRINKPESGVPAPGVIVINDSNGNEADLVAVVWVTVAELEGYAVIQNYTAGFLEGDTIREDTTAIGTLTTDAVPITLLPGGRFEFVSHNFFGETSTYDVYGCDGVNPAFRYAPDTQYFTPIYTDQANPTIDIPSSIAVYRNHLFVGYDRGIIRNSEPGDPLLWDAAAGSIEIGVGAAVTGFDPTPKSLSVMTSRTTYALTGTISENFELDVSSTLTGARPHTIQHLGTTYMLDDRGVIELSRVQAFGNFENATVSRAIEPLIRRLRPTIIASTVSRSKNIYRLFAADGRGLSMTLQDNNVVSFSAWDVDRAVSCTANGEDETGAERTYFGSDDGFVYEMDRGRSFDGDEKEAWLQPAHHFLDSPTVIKRFYRMFIDAVVSGESSMTVFAEFSLGASSTLPTEQIVATFRGSESAWDVGLWDVALYDGRLSADTHIELTGSGDAISTIFYSFSATDDIAILKDVVYHYKLRRAMRGSR